MKITRKSIITGIERVKDLDITPEALAKWEEGQALIQEVAGHLTLDEREFIMTGIVPEEWEEYVPEEWERYVRDDETNDIDQDYDYNEDEYK